MDLATAGAAALAGITAISAIEALALDEGDTLLVVGATGGVGSLAVQLAAAAGATVIAPAFPEDEHYLRSLGVAEIVPRNGDVSTAVRERHPNGADALLDNVSYAAGAYDTALKEGAPVASPNNAAGQGPGHTNLYGRPNQRKPGSTSARSARRRHPQGPHRPDPPARPGGRRNDSPRHHPHTRQDRPPNRLEPIARCRRRDGERTMSVR